MSMKSSLAGALAGLLFCGFAAAAGPAQANEDPDELVCTYEKKTGSHIKRRVCISRAERERRAREDQDAMQKLTGSKAAQGAGSRGPSGP